MQVAVHLSNTYGDEANKVADLSSLTGKRWPVIGRRLHEEFPYIEAEVMYAVKEYARTAVDVLARRTRLSFLNVLAAEEALPRVIQIMAKELKWDEQKAKVGRFSLVIVWLDKHLVLPRKKPIVPKHFSFARWVLIWNVICVEMCRSILPEKKWATTWNISDASMSKTKAFWRWAI